MLRGRHRGLPVAIDRAVILPFEFRGVADEAHNHDRDDPVDPEWRSSHGSMFANGPYPDPTTSEKLQRRSWRTSSPDAPERTSNLTVDEV